MFKLNLKSGEKKIAYKPLSVTAKYLIDGKKLHNDLNNIERIFNVKISELQKSNFLVKSNNTLRVPKYDGKPDEIILNKIVIDKNFNNNYFRNNSSELIQSLKSSEVKNLHLFIPDYREFEGYFSSEQNFLQSFVEGLYLGNYEFKNYKSDQNEKKELSIYFYYSNQELIEQVLNYTKILMEGVKFTRDLQNEPSNNLTPLLFAQKIIEKFKNLDNVSIKVFDEKEIQKRSMGGLWAVGKGSQNPPRFVVIEYNLSKENKDLPLVSLVGKGITFDSGGISIKPGESMDEMKADMSGAAVVTGTLYAAAKFKIPTRVVGILALAENMPSGNALKPGDIVKTSSGKSIEVLNTDAEGRIVLADALEYASKLKPDVIIDLATLTGACVVALGEVAAGMFTQNDELANNLYLAGNDVYERVWRLPLWDTYSQFVKSEIADIKNLGKRWGGAITAAKFLEYFVDENINWAHLDIAGPAMAHEENSYSGKYMTGFGVRLLIKYITDNFTKKVKGTKKK